MHDVVEKLFSLSMLHSLPPDERRSGNIGRNAEASKSRIGHSRPWMRPSMNTNTKTPRLANYRVGESANEGLKKGAKSTGEASKDAYEYEEHHRGGAGRLDSYWHRTLTHRPTKKGLRKARHPGNIFVCGCARNSSGTAAVPSLTT